MARLEPVQPRGLDPLRRLIFAAASRMYGRPLEPTRIIAHHRPLLAGFASVGLASERFSQAVDQRLKYLAMLRTSQLIGCEWCLDFGSWLAQRSGVSEQDLRELSIWRQSERFSDLDRLVLEYAEAMTRTPVEVPAELFARLRAEFDQRQIVELTMSVALENLYSRFNWAVGIEGEGFSEGMFCLVPDRAEEPRGSAVAAAS
jgi:AhpD family alkylhydroperoxidase